MSVTLASAWRPRGEGPRLKKLLPLISQVYEQMIVAVGPGMESQNLEILQSHPNVIVVVTAGESWRHGALQRSLDTPASHVHYVDMDRLLRWVETRPLEWRQTVETVPQTDCLIIGRTPAAFETHPQAIRETDTIVNLVFSHLLGQTVDLCGGARGFSRRAIEFLLTHSTSQHAFSTDAEWPILLQRAGYTVSYLAVDGLDWETADRFRSHAADRKTQQRVAEAYDRDVRHWALRVQTTLAIVQEGLAAAQQPLGQVNLPLDVS